MVKEANSHFIQPCSGIFVAGEDVLQVAVFTDRHASEVQSLQLSIPTPLCSSSTMIHPMSINYS